MEFVTLFGNVDLFWFVKSILFDINTRIPHCLWLFFQCHNFFTLIYLNTHTGIVRLLTTHVWKTWACCKKCKEAFIWVSLSGSLLSQQGKRETAVEKNVKQGSVWVLCPSWHRGWHTSGMCTYVYHWPASPVMCLTPAALSGSGLGFEWLTGLESAQSISSTCSSYQVYEWIV